MSFRPRSNYLILLIRIWVRMMCFKRFRISRANFSKCPCFSIKSLFYTPILLLFAWTFYFFVCIFWIIFVRMLGLTNFVVRSSVPFFVRSTCKPTVPRKRKKSRKTTESELSKTVIKKICLEIVFLLIFGRFFQGALLRFRLNCFIP